MWGSVVARGHREARVPDTQEEARTGIDLRRTFDQVAELYDEVRPRYPVDALEELVRLAGIRPGTRVLEIGPGTGQLTVPLAERGADITAIELGPRLAEVARRNLNGFANTSVVVADFETWPLPATPFDAVVSASAFHWLDPDKGVRKVADALRPGGSVATLGAQHVAGGDTAVFERLVDCYLEWDPATDPDDVPQPAAEIPPGGEALERSGRFERLEVRRFEWEVTYSTAEYLRLLSTYSGHIALVEDRRRGLFDCITTRLEANGGRVRKGYLSELVVGYRAA